MSLYSLSWPGNFLIFKLSYNFPLFSIRFKKEKTTIVLSLSVCFTLWWVKSEWPILPWLGRKVKLLLRLLLNSKWLSNCLRFSTYIPALYRHTICEHSPMWLGTALDLRPNNGSSASVQRAEPHGAIWIVGSFPWLPYVFAPISLMLGTSGTQNTSKETPLGRELLEVGPALALCCCFICVCVFYVVLGCKHKLSSQHIVMTTHWCDHIYQRGPCALTGPGCEAVSSKGCLGRCQWSGEMGNSKMKPEAFLSKMCVWGRLSLVVIGKALRRSRMST